jgi:hypothetical protein
MDSKFSFLGYYIEFVNVNDTSSLGKIPIGIDGTFKLTIPHGEYKIKIYDEKGLVKIDEKSPSIVENEDIFIPYFDDTFSSFICKTDLDGLTYKYVNLVRSIDYLDDYGCIGDVDIIDYIERLLEISHFDRNAYPQTLAYLDYLERLVDDATCDLEFLRLADNIKNKIDIADEKGLFDTMEFKNQMEAACKVRSLDDLNDIYMDLIEKYVILNEDNVLIDVFFNLRYDGIYTTSKQLAEEFIKDGLQALNDIDYDELFKIIEKLYEIDERNYMV